MVVQIRPEAFREAARPIDTASGIARMGAAFGRGLAEARQRTFQREQLKAQETRLEKSLAGRIEQAEIAGRQKEALEWVRAGFREKEIGLKGEEARKTEGVKHEYRIGEIGERAKRAREGAREREAGVQQRHEDRMRLAADEFAFHKDQNLWRRAFDLNLQEHRLALAERTERLRRLAFDFARERWFKASEDKKAEIERETTEALRDHIQDVLNSTETQYARAATATASGDLPGEDQDPSVREKHAKEMEAQFVEEMIKAFMGLDKEMAIARVDPRDVMTRIRQRAAIIRNTAMVKQPKTGLIFFGAPGQVGTPEGATPQPPSTPYGPRPSFRRP